MITPRERETLEAARQKAATLLAKWNERHTGSPLEPLWDAGRQAVERIGFPHKTDEMFTYIDTTRLHDIFLPTGDFESGEEVAVAAAGFAEASRPHVARGDGDLAARQKEALQKERDIFAALNAAQATRITRIGFFDGHGSVQPMEVSLISAGPAPAFPRIDMTAATGAHGVVIVRLKGEGAQNGVIDVTLEDESTLALYLVNEGGKEPRFLKINVTQGAKSSCKITTVTAGGPLSRISFDVTMKGEGAEVEMATLALLAGEQQAHYHARITHEAPRCQSHLLWRSLIDGSSTTSVDGTVMVARGAEGTVSNQQAKSLALSSAATANVKPNLMIENDDVLCSHGATLGRIDESQLLYLRSRGIPEKEALVMVARSFAAAIVDTIAGPDLAAEAASLVDALLSEEA